VQVAGEDGERMEVNIAKRTSTEMQIGGFRLTKTGIVIVGEPTREEWLEAKGFSDKCHSGAMWWVGDLLNFGEATYDEVEEDGPYDRQTLKDAKYVCANVAASVRTDGLSFTHHKLVAHLPARQQVAWLKRAARDTLTVGQMRKAIRQQRLDAERTAAKKPGCDAVGVLLADPPWQYDFSETTSREIENQYPTATPEEIALHLGEWGPDLNEDCVLFLWATAPKLREALFVMEAWEFEYKTHAVWDKERLGMGYWFRGQHELLLVGTRGSFSPPDAEDRVSSVFRERRDNKHSKKPMCVYEALEQMFPDATKFEMYQREPREGWLGGGNEL